MVPRRWLFVAALCAVPLVALAQPPAATAPTLAGQHQSHGLACAACHRETPATVAAPDQVCIDCHGGVAALVARAQNYEPNPHLSPHTEVPQCTTCHHAHKAAEIACRACHADKSFVKQ